MTLKIKHSDICIWGYICFLCAYLISVSQIVEYYPEIYLLRTVLRIAGYGICLYKISSLRMSINNFFVILFFFSIIFLSRIITQVDTLVIDFLLISCVQDVNKEKLIMVDLKIRIIAFIVLFLSVQLGLVEDYVGYRNGALVRASWGFNGPNRLGMHLLIICLDTFYLHFGKFKKIHWMIIIASALIMNFVADSRSSLVCIVLLVMIDLLYLILKKISIKISNKLLMIISDIAFIAAIFISFYLPYCYNSGKIFLLGGEDTIGSRIIKAAYAIRTYGITLFGKKIEVVTNAEAIKLGTIANGIDNMYVYILVNFGIIFFIGIVFLLIYTIHYLTKNNNYTALICFVILLIFALVENPILKIESNVFLFFLGDAILNNHKNKKQIQVKTYRKNLRGIRLHGIVTHVIK